MWYDHWGKIRITETARVTPRLAAQDSTDQRETDKNEGRLQVSQTFDHISKFLREEMRMSHIYQPVMLRHLLERGGQATVTSIAKAILLHDPTQVEYYKHIVKRYPGSVLSNPKKDLVERNGNSYAIKNFEDLSDADIEKLLNICDEKLVEYLDSMITSPWDHRRPSSGYIAGSKIYEVLKNAKYRCQLCGASAEHVALTVDHIVPRKLGGTDDLSNLQALCHQCNSRKRATDDVDFRGVAESYNVRQHGCPFCHIPTSSRVSESALCYSMSDSNPVSIGHLLIIPKRHVADYFDLHQPERNDIERALARQKVSLQDSDKSITGFNVGFDSGEDAGQDKPHCHLHLIPRRRGDSNSPRSGIRGAIPG